jgi:hypothetical protein
MESNESLTVPQSESLHKHKQQRLNLVVALLQTISELMVGVPRITVQHLLILCQLHVNLVLELDLTLKDLVLNFLASQS